MINLKSKTLALLGFLMTFSLMSYPLLAQEDTVEDAEVQVDEDDTTEEVIVTGSRLRKTSFTSVSPLQVITTEASREVGLIDPADILQESTAASGQQIDLTFQGFVLDNGPGSSTASLRGLGSARSLILVNGRRVAPSGVEGAPSAPDLNLIPGGLVDRYDILLDGASSIYGSDAVAGVVNVILKKDFEGFNVEFNTTIPEQSNGEDYTANITWGKNFDRGFIGAGLEYYSADEVTLDDRDWTRGCNTAYEIDQSGQIRTLDLNDQVFNGQSPAPCKRQGLAGRFIMGAGLPFGGFGSVYYQPGQGNVLGDWSESSVFGVFADADGDGVTDVNFQDHIINGREGFQSLYAKNERTSFMTFGEYTFQGDMNITPYFEAMYNERETFADSGVFQLFPVISADNKFNPCNPNGQGVDCGLAQDAYFQDPEIIADFTDVYGVPPAAFGLGFYGPSGPITAQPVAAVIGDRTRVTSKLDSTRIVAGFRGDLPQIPIGGENDWKFDVAFVHSESDGTASRPGIRQDRIDLASTTIDDPTSPTGLRCDGDGDGVRELTEGCFQVNFFAPSLYANVVGDFATQAERDFLFDTRDFRTKYEQTIGSFFLNGSLFEMPGGTAQGGIGYSYRDDKINSLPDDIARDGLFFGYFSDGGAVGDKYTTELTAEIDLPLLANKHFAKEMGLNLSANLTDDEIYGSDTTYSGKFNYSPTDSLTLKATYGTSYRAPNLREVFLKDQSGFNTVVDHCAIPEDAYNIFTGAYDPTQDDRVSDTPQVFDNCLAAGIDPTTHYVGASRNVSAEIFRGGTSTLLAETSDSLTYGFSFEQPFFDAFDMTLGMTYYEIDIEDTIIEPSGAGIVNGCYLTQNGINDPNCTRIIRQNDGTGVFRITGIDAAFQNRDLEATEGIDVNVLFQNDITLFDRSFDFAADLNMNRTISNTLTSSAVNDAGELLTTTTEFAGRFGFPDWAGNLNLRAQFNEYRFTWGMRYIGEVEQFGHEYSDVFVLSDTCLGPDEGDLLCKDVNFAPSYVNHSASLFYYGDTWTLGGGISNIFDKWPPQVDSAQVLATNNTPIGYGYDLQGRSVFLTIARKF